MTVKDIPDPLHTCATEFRQGSAARTAYVAAFFTAYSSTNLWRGDTELRRRRWFRRGLREGRQARHEARTTTIWMWLSFADGHKAPGDTWLGGCYVSLERPAPTSQADANAALIEAVRQTKRLGINPGGEVLAYVCKKAPPEGYRNRLLSRADMEALGGPRRMTPPPGIKCAMHDAGGCSCGAN